MVFAHIAILYFEYYITNTNSSRVDYIFYLSYCCRRQVFLGSTRISKYQNKVSFFYAFERDREEVFRFVRDIILGVFRRAIVFVSIDTEEGEIPSVAWPYPVVCIGTELTDRGGGSSYQAYILEGLCDKENVLVSIIESLYTIFLPSLFRSCFDDLSNIFLDEFGFFSLVSDAFCTFEYLLGDIVDTHHKGNF